MAEIVNGINTDGIADLMLEISTINDDVALIFDKIDMQVSLLDSYLKGNANTNVKSLYDDIRKNYIIVKKNITSYETDYKNLIVKMKDAETTVTNKFIEYTESAKEQANKIEIL